VATEGRIFAVNDRWVSRALIFVPDRQTIARTCEVAIDENVAGRVQLPEHLETLGLLEI
jgi:hypothetical protein